jgi:protein subunit release factor A
MKTQEQIERVLSAYLEELDSLNDWCNKAQENYKKDKEMWGNEADDGEWRYANDEYNKVNQKIKMLKWILNIETTP